MQVAPYGLLVEKAGGKTSDGVTGGSVLDVKITTVNPKPEPLASEEGTTQEVFRTFA